MGARLAALVDESQDLSLAGATERSGHEVVGRDIGTIVGSAPSGLVVVDDLASVVGCADVVIDFTAPAVTVEIARICGQAGVALVIGTTGSLVTDN